MRGGCGTRKHEDDVAVAVVVVDGEDYLCDDERKREIARTTSMVTILELQVLNLVRQIICSYINKIIFSLRNIKKLPTNYYIV